MTKTLGILILIIAFGLSNCSRRSRYICGLDYWASKPKIDSKVLRLQRVAIADTTIAFISGTIFGRDSLATGVVTDTLIGANVYAVDKKTGKTYGMSTNINGKYQFNLPASTYDLKVQYIAYNTLIVRNAFFGTGDMVEFDVALGLGSRQDSTEFLMQADRTIKAVSQQIKTKKK